MHLVRAAMKPGHYDDFDVNAVGTLNLLKATRQQRSGAALFHISANLDHGSQPDGIPLKEFDTRWDYGDPAGEIRTSTSAIGAHQQ